MTNAVRLFARLFAVCALAALMCCAALALTGCGGDTDTADQTAASVDEQDNCYGDDLPAVSK